MIKPVWPSLVGVVALGIGFMRQADAIPAFAREYGVSCGTCHSAFPALNANGEAFRLSGYRRFLGGKAEPITPHIKVGDRLDLPASVPISLSATAGFDFNEIDNELGDGSRNTNTEDDFRRSQNSFDLASVEILAGAALGGHASFFLDAPLAELEQRQFFDPEVREHGVKSTLEGPEVPERVFAGFHDIFAPDLLNVMGGVIELPTPFSPEATRLSFFPYLIYAATALDVIARAGVDDFVGVPGANEEDLERNQFRLDTHQIGAEVFGRITPAVHGVSELYVDYFLGVVNGNNINTDNNDTKDFVGRLAFTYPLGEVSMTLGGFGYYSGNTLDDRTTNPQTGVAYEDALWRAGPDISLTLQAPVYARIFSQVLFAEDSNPTGFERKAEWWGGLVQGEIKPLEDLIAYVRYDWIDGQRFNDTDVSLNGVSGATGVVDPWLWDVVVGTQYFVYDNLKIFAEYRHGEKDLKPASSPALEPIEQLKKTAEDAVFAGFRLVF